MSQLMPRLLAVVLAGSVLSSGAVAQAETLQCKRAIAKDSSKYVQVRHKTLQKCIVARREAGDPPAGALAACTAAVATQLAKAASKLEAAIDKACGGDDGLCGGDLTGEDLPASIGWPASCPNIENGPCTAAVADCGDIAGCIQCVGDRAVDRIATVNYESFLDQPAESAQNDCQVAVASSLLGLFNSRSKALTKCADSALTGKPDFSSPCPAGDLSGKTQAKIGDARVKTVGKICKACGGNGDRDHDGRCDDPGFSPQTDIGSGLTCPPLKVPGGANCGVIGAVDTLQSYADCVTCLIGFNAHCLESAALVGEAPYPAECNPAPRLTLPGTIPVAADSNAVVLVSLTVPAPPGDLHVTLTSADPGRLLISTSAAGPGSASIMLSAAAGSYGPPAFYAQAQVSSGSVDITATAPGYASASSAVILDPPGTPRPAVTVSTPLLDVAALHARWEAMVVPPGVVCTWPSYRVGAATTGSGTDVASLSQALADANAEETNCGPTVYFGPGRYDGPALEITQPTILVGEPGAEISTTIASTQGQPLWIQDFKLVDASYPGAIFASHPANETTVIRVDIDSPSGVGIIQNGGYMSIWDSTIHDATTIRNTFDPRVSPMQILGGFGQPATVSGAQLPAGVLFYLGQVGELARKDVGPSLDEYITISLAPYEFVSVDLGSLECAGTGIWVSGTGLLEAAFVSVLDNPTAGLVLDHSTGYLTTVASGNNGITVDDSINNLPNLLDNALCYGGILARNESLLLAEVAVADGNYPFGVGFVDSEASMGQVTSRYNDSTHGNLGDGFVGIRSFVSLPQVHSHHNRRSGMTFVYESSANVGGVSTAQMYGLVIRSGSEIYYEGLDLQGNEVSVLPDGDLPVPNKPLPVPSFD